MYKKGKSGDRNIQKAYESGVSLVRKMNKFLVRPFYARPIDWLVPASLIYEVVQMNVDPASRPRN